MSSVDVRVDDGRCSPFRLFVSCGWTLDESVDVFVVSDYVFVVSCSPHSPAINMDHPNTSVCLLLRPVPIRNMTPAADGPDSDSEETGQHHPSIIHPPISRFIDPENIP